jgi:hypothetical protein
MAQATPDMMMKPGDVVIDEITLRSYSGFTMSVKGLFHQFVIYEDIFSNFMSGYIILIDSQNLAKNFPIIGAETLTISYKTPLGTSNPVRLVFRTYKISVQTETAQQVGQMIRLEFVSHHAIKSMQTKVSKSFINMPVSRMVENIFNEYLAIDYSENDGAINNNDIASKVGRMVSNSNSPLQASKGGFESQVAAASGLTKDNLAKQEDQGKIGLKTVVETFDSRSYVLPYWTPFYAINWLAHRARAKEDTSLCDYVLFQNSDGYHFAPISKLKTLEPAFTYTNFPPGFRDNQGERMFLAEMRNIHSYVIENKTDKIKEQSIGMLASALLTHDITTKKWNTTHFTYDKSFRNEGNSVDRYPIVPIEKTDYSSAVESHLRFYPKSTFTMEGKTEVNDPNEIVLLRQSLLARINSINLIASCYGDTNVKVGQIIDFRTESKESTKKQDKFEDDYLSGRYLLTAIKHEVTDREHLMTMTLSKDSHAEPIADVKKSELSAENP